MPVSGGSSGTRLLKRPEDLSLLEIYQAVNGDDVERQLKETLAKDSLADVIDRLKQAAEGTDAGSTTD